jgi:hypothetical protein
MARYPKMQGSKREIVDMLGFHCPDCGGTGTRDKEPGHSSRVVKKVYRSDLIECWLCEGYGAMIPSWATELYNWMGEK